MPGLEETLDLRLDDALGQIDRLESEILGASERAATKLAADLLGAIEAASAGIDAAAFEIPVTTAIDVSSLTDLRSEIDASVAEPARITIESDTAAVDEAAGAVNRLDAEITAIPDAKVDADTSSVVAAVDDVDQLVDKLAEASAPIDIDVSASGATAATDELQETTDAAAQLNQTGAGFSTALATGVDIASGSVSTLSGALGKAAGPIAGIAASVGALFSAAETGRAATERLNIVFGETADQVTKIDIGGLQGDMAALARETGSSGAQLKQAAANLGQLAQSAGASSEEAAGFTKNISALSLRAVALNPQLGQAGDAANQMTTAFARGGRALVPFGLSLTKAQIEARALADSGKATAAELSVYERAAAGAALATEQLGSSLGTDFQRGADQSANALKRLQAELTSALAEAGAPLVDPIIDALSELVPVAKSVAGVIGEIAPVFVTAFGAAAKVVEGLAFVLDHIPAPLLQAIAGFVAFRTAISLGYSVVAKLGGGLVNLVTQMLTVQAAATRTQVAFGWIGIVAGALGAVAGALGLFGGSADDAAAAARDLRDAMDSAGEALLDTGKAATVAAGAAAQLKFDTEKAKKFQGLIDLFPASFNKAGVTALELARTVEHGGPAFDTMKTAILDAARAAGVSEGKLRALENGLDAARASAQAAAETTAENARTQIDNNDALEVGQIAALKAAGHYDLLSEAHRRNGDRLLAEHDALQKNTRALGDHMSAQDRARANARRAERQADQLARAVEKEADAYNDAKDALDRYLGKPLDLAHQELELEKSISDTRDAFKDGAGAIDASTGAINTHTVAGQRLTDQLLSDADTIGTTIKALAETGDIEGANRALADYRQRLINAAGGGEVATKAIDRFLESVNLVPKKVTTQYENSGLGKAARELDNYNKAIDVFPTEKQTIWRNIEDPAARAQAISDYIQSLPREKWVEYRTKLNERELDIVNGRIVKLTARRKAEIRLETDPASRVQAQKELDHFTEPRTVDIHVRVVPDSAAAARLLADKDAALNAYGGIYVGGARTFATGGLDRANRHLAQLAGPGVRIWAEPETAGEAYIPLASDDRRARATQILDDVAGRFGFDLVKHDALPAVPAMLVQSRDSEGVSRDKAIVRALERVDDTLNALLAVNKRPPQPRRGQQRQAPVVAGDIVVRDRKEAVDVLADLADRLH